jgi:hypothetical protein
LIIDRNNHPRSETTVARAIPTRTLQSIAACSALGLSYWADHPKPGYLWAVDPDKQEFVPVHIQRRAGLVELATVPEGCHSLADSRVPIAMDTHVVWGTPVVPYDHTALVGQLELAL